jgi:hypothetical protein
MGASASGRIPGAGDRPVVGDKWGSTVAAPHLALVLPGYPSPALNVAVSTPGVERPGGDSPDVGRGYLNVPNDMGPTFAVAGGDVR